MRTHGQDNLSPEQIQLFAASLSGLPRDEIKKAKQLYIRNAISGYELMKTSFGSFGCAWIIPIFWPVLFIQRRMIKASMKHTRNCIRNAVEVWRDDLDGERFELDGERL